MSFRIGRLTVEISFLFTAFFALLLSGGAKIMPVFLSALLHETGHAVCLLAFGEKTLTVSLYPGGAAISRRGSLTPGRELAAAIAGPSVNAILGFFSLLQKTEAAAVFSRVNFLLCLCNLLPISFLDGGRALGCVFDLVGASAKYQNVSLLLDFFVLCCLCCLCAVLRMLSGAAGSVLLFTLYCFFQMYGSLAAM